MGTLRKVLTVFVLLLSIAAFVLGLANFDKRENLIGRTHELEQAVIGLANFIEDPGAVRAAAAAEDDDLDVDAAAAAAEDESEDVEHVSWDVDQVDAQPNDARIAICADFDFEKRQLSFCEQNDEEWRAYSLRDIAGAAYTAERRKYISPGERAELFADYLSGKELPFADESEDLSEDESPGLTM